MRVCREEDIRRDGNDLTFFAVLRRRYAVFLFEVFLELRYRSITGGFRYVDDFHIRIFQQVFGMVHLAVGQIIDGRLPEMRVEQPV